MLPRVQRALILIGMALIQCFPCPARSPQEAGPAGATAKDFEIKLVNNEFLVRRKGTSKWEHSRNVNELVKLEWPGGSYAYLGTKAIKAPKAKRTPDPDFPLEARDQHKQGLVAMYAVVDEKGTVRSPTVYSSSGPEFTNAAIQALQNWLFEPARLNNQSVPVLMNFVMRFRFSR